MRLGRFRLFRDFGAGDNNRTAAVADDAAIEPVQRVGDHRRVDDILDGDDVAQHRVRIVLRVMRGRDFDQASCSLVVPYWCMWRIAHIAYMFAVAGP